MALSLGPSFLMRISSSTARCPPYWFGESGRRHMAPRCMTRADLSAVWGLGLIVLWTALGAAMVELERRRRGRACDIRKLQWQPLRTRRRLPWPQNAS